MIALRFVQYKDLAARATAFVQRDGWATHVESITPEGTWLGSQSPEGVLDRPEFYDIGTTIVREQIVEVKDATEDQSKAFYAFMRGQIGKPYSYLGLIDLTLGTRNWRLGKAWFCSELVARALEVAGYWQLASICSHIDPRDLYLILSGRLNFQPK